MGWKALCCGARSRSPAAAGLYITIPAGPTRHTFAIESSHRQAALGPGGVYCHEAVVAEAASANIVKIGFGQEHAVTASTLLHQTGSCPLGYAGSPLSSPLQVLCPSLFFGRLAVIAANSLLHTGPCWRSYRKGAVSPINSLNVLPLI